MLKRKLISFFSLLNYLVCPPTYGGNLSHNNINTDLKPEATTNQEGEERPSLLKRIRVWWDYLGSRSKNSTSTNFSSGLTSNNTKSISEYFTNVINQHPATSSKSEIAEKKDLPTTLFSDYEISTPQTPEIHEDISNLKKTNGIVSDIEKLPSFNEKRTTRSIHSSNKFKSASFISEIWLDLNEEVVEVSEVDELSNKLKEDDQSNSEQDKGDELHSKYNDQEDRTSDRDEEYDLMSDGSLESQVIYKIDNAERDLEELKHEPEKFKESDWEPSQSEEWDDSYWDEDEASPSEKNVESYAEHNIRHRFKDKYWGDTKESDNDELRYESDDVYDSNSESIQSEEWRDTYWDEVTVSEEDNNSDSKENKGDEFQDMHTDEKEDNDLDELNDEIDQYDQSETDSDESRSIYDEEMQSYKFGDKDKADDKVNSEPSEVGNSYYSLDGKNTKIIPSDITVKERKKNESLLEEYDPDNLHKQAEMLFEIIEFDQEIHNKDTVNSIESCVSNSKICASSSNKSEYTSNLEYLNSTRVEDMTHDENLKNFDEYKMSAKLFRRLTPLVNDFMHAVRYFSNELVKFVIYHICAM